MSPGFILSGLYPTKKSMLYFSLEYFCKVLTQISSVAPGYTVLSYITTSFLFKNYETVLLAEINGLKSGFLNESTGVGTVII